MLPSSSSAGKKTGRFSAPLALALLWLAAAGCEDVGYGNSPRYGISATPAVRSASVSRPAPAAPAAKVVAPSPSAPVAAKTVSSPAATASVKSKPAARSGGLEDLIRDIEQSDREKARRAQKEERRKRELWLDAHDADFSGVRTRLSGMQISLLSISGAGARESVSKAIADTEKEIDALRKKYGDGKVGFNDASRLRNNMENRHAALRGSCPEYRQLTDN
jgi:hypothetical protein